MWPSLISQAKQGGIDVIETYVFWNQHEPKPGQVTSHPLILTHSSYSNAIFSGINSMISVEDVI